MSKEDKEIDLNERLEGTPLSEYTRFIEKSAQAVVKASRQLDEFEYNDILRPPYDPKTLIDLVERNDSIKQLIDALATNVALFGHGIKYDDDFDYNKADDQTKKVADKEWDILRVKYKNINNLEDFSQILYKALLDKYTIGWGCLEVIRNALGDVNTIEYARACNIRIAKNNDSRTTIEMWEESSKGKYNKKKNPVKFKKFVQMVNGKKVFFKEFGDPRQMDCSTGEYSENIPFDKQATEIIFLSSHSSHSDYGIPFWVNVSLSASGSVMADILNYKYFFDGKILPVAITVSGGQLTKESVKAIRDGTGTENAYKMLILEASPLQTKKLDGDIEESPVKLDIKSLTDTLNSDSLFQEYQKQGKEKARDASRLPPIFTGASSDYNRATAATAREIAEEQIFVPERKAICSKFNKIINNDHEIKYCEVYLKGAVITDLEAKNAILKTPDEAGALTPNILIDLLSQMLNKDIEPWDKELGNIPFKLLMQREASASSDDSGASRDIEILSTVKSEIKKSISEVI